MQLPKTRIIKIIFSTFLLLCIYSSSKAQNPEDIITDKKSYFKFAVGYLSNSVYFGRKDSLALPYIIPAISYHNKIGLYLEGSLSYLAGTGSQIDAGAITAGYEFNSHNEKFSGDIYASKYFTNNSSYSVKGEVKGALGGSLNYNTGPLTVNGGLDVSFSSKSDIGLSFGLSHPFELGDNHWAITPSALVNAGTQNFYENYFTNRKYSLKRKRRLIQNLSTIKVIVVTKSFAVLDYELSMPVDYTGHKWGLFFTPTFSIPQNGFKYSINNGATYQTEKLSNSFYAEVGAYIKF